MKQHSKVLEYLNTVTSEISFKEARPGIQKELLSHIEEHLQTAHLYGVNREDAVDQSLMQMGHAGALGASLNKVHQSTLDFLPIGIVAALCTIGLYSLHASGWAPLQLLWTAIGATLGLIILNLPYQILIKTLAVLYPIAIAGLIAAQFSGIIVDGQPYLNVLGLKIKMIDLASASHWLSSCLWSS